VLSGLWDSAVALPVGGGAGLIVVVGLLWNLVGLLVGRGVAMAGWVGFRGGVGDGSVF